MDPIPVLCNLRSGGGIGVEEELRAASSRGGVPLEPRSVLADEQLVRVDAGEVNGQIFVNGVSLGLYPRTLRLRGRWEPRVGKWPAALLATCITLAGFSHRPRWRHDAASADAPGDPLVWIGAGRGSFRSPRHHPKEFVVRGGQGVGVDVGLDGELLQLEFPLRFRIRESALRAAASGWRAAAG